MLLIISCETPYAAQCILFLQSNKILYHCRFAALLKRAPSWALHAEFVISINAQCECQSYQRYTANTSAAQHLLRAIGRLPKMCLSCKFNGGKGPTSYLCCSPLPMNNVKGSGPLTRGTGVLCVSVPGVKRLLFTERATAFTLYQQPEQHSVLEQEACIKNPPADQRPYNKVSWDNINKLFSDSMCCRKCCDGNSRLLYFLNKCVIVFRLSVI